MGCYLIYDDTSTIESVVAASQGHQTVGGGGLQHQPSGTGGRSKGREYRGGHGNRGTGRYVGTLPPGPALMVPGREDVEHDPGGEGGAVLDRLHYGNGSPSLWKCLCLGPQA